MALAPGTRIDSYEIVALIGRGGMGEVYRARDTQLGRDVALKVLPEAFAADAERLARFEREARVLAGLNHPNIAAIYGVKDAAPPAGDSQDRSGRVRAFVMELVEGPTLEDVIRSAGNHGLDLDDALPIARQIADALEAAHGAGVIHRDLKPANIKVRPDGTVKVLDFGLAKALDASGAPVGDAANSPTLTGHGTRLGTILGTAAYMAPEQARGRAVDKRADLWAFGCLLFEMLTGRRAFAGDTVTDILAAVVRAEPDWSAVPANTPPSIRRLLKRCLTKDPAQRLADASTAKLEIDDARREPAAATPAAVGTPSSRGRERLAWIVAGAMTLVTIVATITAIRRSTPTVTNPAEMRFEIAEAMDDAVVSPDGTEIVYSALVDGSPRWVLRSLASGTSRPIPGFDQATYNFFWSPDGRSIGFLAAQKLKRIDLATGAVQTLADAPTPRGGTWGPDGTILFAPGGNGPIYRIPASGGTPEPVSQLRESDASHRHPIFLPDGRHFLFWVLGPSGVRGEYLGSLDDRRVVRLCEADGPAAFAAPDQVLFIREGVLYAQRLDVAGAKLVGDAATIASPFQANQTAPPRMSASRTGVIAFRTDPELRQQIQWVNETGTKLETIGQPILDVYNGSLSPDGRTIAVSRLQNGDAFIWLLDVSRGTMSKFSHGSGAMWSPDGNRIAFHSGRDGFGRLYWQRVGTNEPAELLFKSNEAQNMVDWSPDSQHIVFSSQSPTNARDLWVLPTTGDRTPKPFVQTAAEERNGAFSPDGKWFAYESDENGRIAIFVRPFPGPGRAWRVSTGVGQLPFWRADGRSIFYLVDTQLTVVAFTPTTGAPTLGTPTPLFALRRQGQRGDLLLRARTDGSRFLLAALTGSAPATSPLTVIVNWSNGK